MTQEYINPYDVLEVSQAASNAEITKAFMQAMKRKKYKPDVIAGARKALMNTEERIIADYLKPILPPIKRFKKEDFSELEKPEPELEILPEFDNLETIIEMAKDGGEIDKRLGKMLFSD